MILEIDEAAAQKKSAYYNNLAVRARYDEGAFNELYEHFFPRVYNFIFGRVKNVDSSDDIISATFEKVFLHLEEFDCSKGAFSTWLFRIAINEMENMFRKEKHLNETSWAELFDPADERMTPEENFVIHERDKELLLALEKLSVRERCIVKLKYFAEASNKEIAELKGLTPTNVGVILHRALEKIKKAIT